MTHLKKSILEMQAEENSLAHDFIIPISRLENDPNYNSYRRGYSILPVVQKLLKTTGIDLSYGAGTPELFRFQEHFRECKILVYQGLSWEDIMFEDQIDSSKRINLLYDEVERHYHVIANLTAATARKYACKGFNKACRRDVTYACDQTCSDCMASLPCAFPNVRIPCAECNRHNTSHTCFDNHEQRTLNRKSVCERKRCCTTCGWALTHGNHECNKRFCDKCKENREVGHLCYMRPLKKALPPQVIRYYTYSVILRRPKIPSTRTMISYTYLLSSACNTFVPGTRKGKT